MADRDDTLSPALHSLVARFAEMMRGVGARYGLGAADVDELVQEVRIRIWKSRPASELISTVSASYMYRTAVTAALTIIRRRRTKTHAGDEPLDERHESTALAALGPDDHLTQSVLVQQVESALSTLPASRLPVVRMYLVGHSREEIADLLGWSEAKVRNLLYRGLDDLRAALAERGVGPEAGV